MDLEVVVLVEKRGGAPITQPVRFAYRQAEHQLGCGVLSLAAPLAMMQYLCGAEVFRNLLK